MQRKLHVGILGFGREGRAVLKFISRLPEYRGAAVEMLDQKRSKKYLRNLERFDVVFRSPGVPYMLPEIQRARRAGVIISSGTKLFFERFRGTVVGITGSKGKGTVATLLYRMLRRAGRKALLGGNIGVPAISLLRHAPKKHIAVLELSSFQLQDLKQSPHIAVVLDVFPEHLDAHRSTREYFAAKTSICRFQTKKDAVFYFSDNARSTRIAEVSPGRKTGLPVKDVSKRNIAMAAAVARYLGVKNSVIAAAIKSFRGLPHRLEFVRKIRVHPRRNPRTSAFVKFYNDSAATNPQATVFALAHFKEPVILIAGGKDKGLDCAPLAHALRHNRNVKTIILLGENRKKILAALKEIKNKGLRIMEAKTLASAVRMAYAFVRKTIIHNSKFIILFSPAAASFDMFRDYADRGEAFKRIVKNLKTR